jgi:hypothetical protein
VSTYSDSGYVVAAAPYVCTDCERPIEKGETHLAYKPGQRRTVRVCGRCSLATDGENCLRYSCRATEEANRSAGGPPQ